jgi:hypothetical protein
MDLLDRLLEIGRATVIDVAPIVAILLVFQVLVLRRPLPNPRRIAIGVVYVLLGLTLFMVGLEEALFPIGRTMAAQLTAPEILGSARGAAGSQAYLAVYVFAFAIGFATAIAEPALIAVSLKAHQVSGGAIPSLGLRLAVAFGVAAGVTIGTVRIVAGLSLPMFIIAAYVVVLIMTAKAPRAILPLAYDSGGVATSTVTVPVVAALGLGLAAAIPGRSPLIDGFGLIAFACLFPIMSVLGYASIAQALRRRRSKRRETDVSEADRGSGRG